MMFLLIWVYSLFLFSLRQKKIKVIDVLVENTMEECWSNIYHGNQPLKWPVALAEVNAICSCILSS